MSLQKQRIVSLEQEIQKKDRIIERFKAKKWMQTSRKPSLAKSLIPLKELVARKQWVEALQLSGKLKKNHPNTISISRYRALIFDKMGLKKQAQAERLRIKKLRALRLKTSKMR